MHGVAERARIPRRDLALADVLEQPLGNQRRRRGMFPAIKAF